METLLKETDTSAENHDSDYYELFEKYKKTILFIETLEALTYEPATSERIRSFLTKEGIWKPLPQKN